MTLFLILLAGITLAFSTINLLIGFQKGDNKSYLFLGLMGFCVSVYLLLFSYSIDREPNSILTRIAFFFFLTNFALLPWFLCAYTGYCRLKIQWILSFGMALSMLALLIDRNLFGLPTWNIIAHIAFFGSLAFGFAASKYQFKNGNKNASRLLFGALIILTLLGLDDIMHVYLSSYIPYKLPPFFLPLDYFLVLFMVIMGLRLARDMQMKYHLEKAINIKERQWSNLLDKVHLLVISVDSDRNITYANPYFFKVTGFSEKDVIGRHYINIVPKKDKETINKLSQTVVRAEEFQFYQNTILTNYGEEKNITWTIVGTYDEDGKLVNSTSVGSDITKQTKALNEIIQLKSRLEEENVLLKAELGKLPGSKKIVGKSDAIKYVLQRALQVAPTNTTVILEGETGVGKELVTNYIQQNSNRNQKPFIKLNCAAIPASLLESELFGHLKGAFTGADKNKKGMVELADGGTLFLDEIGEFPIDLQPKLLRFLQEGEFVPLGSEQTKTVDVRIITATNRELLKEIELGNFRNDLYYRLYVYPITIPPLKNRQEDIPEIADLFIKKFALRHGKKITKISKLVVQELQNYSWPGNIRELENVMERAIIVATSETIKLKDLSPVFSAQKKKETKNPEEIATLETAEREHILKALHKTNWQVHGKNGAAILLGINASTLRSRMKKLDIIKP